MSDAKSRNSRRAVARATSGSGRGQIPTTSIYRPLRARGSDAHQTDDSRPYGASGRRNRLRSRALRLVIQRADIGPTTPPPLHPRHHDDDLGARAGMRRQTNERRNHRRGGPSPDSRPGSGPDHRPRAPCRPDEPGCSRRLRARLLPHARVGVIRRNCSLRRGHPDPARCSRTLRGQRYCLHVRRQARPSTRRLQLRC